MSYKAQEVYFHGDPRREVIYMTRGVSERMKYFFQQSCSSYLLDDELKGRLLGLSKYTVRLLRQKNGTQRTTLEVYLRMMELAGITLTPEDVNYAYAEVIYPPEEITRRLKRLRLQTSTGRYVKIGYRRIAELLHTDECGVRRSLLYLKGGSLQTYGAAMKWIAAQEQERGYDDALRFEE